MKQYFDKISNMEDVRNGLYNGTLNEHDIYKSMELLSRLELFNEGIDKVFREWKISTAINLSNTSINRKAWLGQSACFIMYGCNDLTTKKAWFMLTEDVREKANNLAEKRIKEFEKLWNGKLESILTLGSKDATLTEFQMKLPLDYKS